MSVGHVQRVIEASGIPTTSVYTQSFRQIPELMSLPRAVITQHLKGRPLGAPGDTQRQRAVVERALSLLSETTPSIVDFGEPYRFAQTI